MSNESQDSCLLDKTVLDKVLVGELPQLLPRPLLAVQKQLNLLLLQKYTRKFFLSNSVSCLYSSKSHKSIKYANSKCVSLPVLYSE